MYCSILSRQYSIFTSWGILSWLKLVYIWISSPPLLIGDLFFLVCDSWLFQAALICSDVAKDKLPASYRDGVKSHAYTPSILYGMSPFWEVFRQASQCPFSQANFYFLYFWPSEVGDLLEITFSLKNRRNLARQVSSKDSSTMNLGKSAALFTESDLDFILLFEEAVSSVLCSSSAPLWISNSTEFTQTKSPWLRKAYTTSILELSIGFRAPGLTIIKMPYKLRVVKVLFSQRNWPPSNRLLALYSLE